MNNYIQVAAGILPALIFVILYLVLKKKKKAKCIITTICLGIVFIFCLYNGVVSMIINNEPQLTDQNRLNFAYNLALNENELSDSVVREYVQSNNYTNDLSLFNARQSALSGDYKAAKLLYEKVQKEEYSSDVDDEYKLVLTAYNSIYSFEDNNEEESNSDNPSQNTSEEAKNNNAENNGNSTNNNNTDNNSGSENDNSTNNDSNSNSTNNNNDSTNNNNENDSSNNNNNNENDSSKNSNNKTSESDNDTKTETSKDQEVVDLQDIAKRLREKIESQVQSDKDDDLYSSVARYITSAEQIYSQYLQTNQRNSEDITKILRKLESLEENNPKLKQSNTFRLAKMKMLIMNEDYQQIAENIDEYSSYDELLIVSELYVNGYIKNSNFSEELTGNKDDTYNKVINQLENVYDKKYDNEPKSVRNDAKKYIDSLELEQKHIGLATVSINLESKLEICDSNNTTKVYLELSKIENYFNNDEKASEYIEKSMGTVHTCTDDDFSQPMYQVIGIMATNDDPEKLKEVAKYVDKIVTNTTTIKMSDELTQSANNQNKDKEEQQIQFNNYMSDYVSKKCAAINIINIDKSNFPNIRAKIAFDSDIAMNKDDIKDQLTVTDCTDAIQNYKIEKVEYTKANILLCCDLSGSMSSDIGNLKNAVNLFIQNKLSNENLALLTFDDSTLSSYRFGTGDDELIAAANSFSSHGGTNIFDAAVQSINMFGNDDDALNIIILMSDGQDNDKKNNNMIESRIGKACKNKNIQLYSLGLGGGVDAEYLNAMSAFTGGSYLYVNDSSSLKSFYEYINNQFANQYIISYEAKDTTTNERSLMVNMTKDDTHDIEYYTLVDKEDNQGTDSTNVSDNILSGINIKGLDTRLIFKSSTDNIVHLLGSGFKEDDKITAKIQGSLSYDIPYKYIDENTIQLTIPSIVSVGEYDLHMTVGSSKAILDKALRVELMGSEKDTIFGPYKFTSFSKIVDGNKITLDGNVTLNGWLTFNGQVTLEGDLTSSSLQMGDYNGSRITYYESSSQGFAKLLAKNNFSLCIPALQRFTIYNDTAHSLEYGMYEEAYNTSRIPVPVIVIQDMMKLQAPCLRLYPDRLVLDADGFNTDLPFQDKLLNSTKKVFEFKQKADNIIVTNKKIGCELDIRLGHNSDNYTPVLSNFGNMPVYINPLNFELKIDTIRNKYSFKFITKVAFIQLDSIGLSMQWWDNSNSYEQKSLVSKLTPYEIRLYADYNINTVICTVPVTFNKFELSLSQINVSKPISQWCLEGKMSVEAASVDAFLPGFSKYVGDVSAFSFKNAKVKKRLNNSYFNVSTDFYVLNAIKLAEAEIELGSFKYTNTFLNMNKEEVGGFHAKLKTGIMWEADSGNCEIDVSGTTDLAVMNKFVGVWCTGNYSLNVQWWVFEKVIDQQGDVIIGFYTDHSGETVFKIFANYYDKDSKSQTIDIVWDKNLHMELSTTNL